MSAQDAATPPGSRGSTKGNHLHKNCSDCATSSQINPPHRRHTQSPEHTRCRLGGDTELSPSQDTPLKIYLTHTACKTETAPADGGEVLLCMEKNNLRKLSQDNCSRWLVRNGLKTHFPKKSCFGQSQQVTYDSHPL